MTKLTALQRAQNLRPKDIAEHRRSKIAEITASLEGRLSEPEMRSVRAKLQGAPANHQLRQARAIAGEAGPVKCIHAMCMQCLGYNRSDVASCSDRGCPLWHHRPVA